MVEGWLSSLKPWMGLILSIAEDRHGAQGTTNTQDQESEVILGYLVHLKLVWVHETSCRNLNE